MMSLIAAQQFRQVTTCNENRRLQSGRSQVQVLPGVPSDQRKHAPVQVSCNSGYRRGSEQIGVTMTTTSTTNHPDVPLPAGTTVGGDFDQWGHEFRIIWGDDRRVEATDISL